MKRRLLIMLVVLSMLLAGCGNWMDGSYAVVKPHTEQGYRQEFEVTEVSTYLEMRDAMSAMIASGVEVGILSVQNMDLGSVDDYLEKAKLYIMRSDPIGCYAVKNITYEIGTVAGVETAAISIYYNHSKAEIQQIKYVEDMGDAEELIQTALNQCESSLVMKVENYSRFEYEQAVQNYAQTRPDMVMELPQITVTEYPKTGSKRVVEIQFVYQSTRESLRSMQSYVQPVFSSAALYVSGEEENAVKYSRLYAFLMERNAYKQETSITQAYSLLRHGVGDSKAFAVVYAAMCRRARLECYAVSGTRNGEPWCWNIIRQGDVYYHVDLIQSHLSGGYATYTDDQMQGYVWDYSAYPACVEPKPETTGST